MGYRKMICIEQMDGESHQSDYTRCIVSDNGFLYSGGGKLKHQEKVAASSVAAKLKLEAEHSEQMQCNAGDSKHSDSENCGRVTVWCTSSLKPLGSMTFASVIMSLSIVEGRNSTLEICRDLISFLLKSHFQGADFDFFFVRQIIRWRCWRQHLYSSAPIRSQCFSCSNHKSS